MWVYGNGGHGKVVRDMIAWKQPSIIDDADPKYPWKPEYLKEDGFVAIGDNQTRKNIVARITGLGYVFRGPLFFWQMTPGTVVIGNAFVSRVDTTVGEHCIFNTGSSVDHDCKIGNFVHIAPGAHLCGNVEVGDGAFVGAGSIVTPGSRIEPWAFIKAGSLVTPEKIVARV